MASVPYDSLPENAKNIIEEVKERLADLYDSVEGGPHLADESEGFDNDRYALLLKHAITKVNGSGVVHKAFALNSFPFKQDIASGSLTLALLITVIQHFIISYTEQASAEGMASAPYLSRKAYADQWKVTLDMLNEEFKASVSVLDRSMTEGGIQMLVWSNQFPLGYSQRIRPLRPPWYH